MAYKLENDYPIKLLIVGDCSVGKSCFFIKYTTDNFNDNYITTIGLEVRIKRQIVDENDLKLQIWDSSGHQRFRNVTYAYYRSTDGFIIMYDVCNKKSFENIKNWYEQIKAYCKSYAKIILVANKIDKENRIITTQQGIDLAKELDIPFVEISVKNNINVNNLMIDFVGQIRDELKKRNPKIFINKSLNKTFSLKDGYDDNDDVEPPKCCVII